MSAGDVTRSAVPAASIRSAMASRIKSVLLPIRERSLRTETLTRDPRTLMAGGVVTFISAAFLVKPKPSRAEALTHQASKTTRAVAIRFDMSFPRRTIF